MLDPTFVSRRRAVPRAAVSARCWEVAHHQEQRGLVVDLSWEGVRIERPFVPGARAEQVQLELDVPGLGEVIWAKAGPCFDQLVPARSGQGGPLGLIRRTGFRLLAAAQRDLRLLRDFLFEQRRAEAARIELLFARARVPLPSILAHPTLGRAKGRTANANASEQPRPLP